MDFVFRIIDIPTLYYIIACIIVLILFLWKRKWHLALLFGYMFLVLTETILIREIGEKTQYFLHLFWSYKAFKDQWKQILTNIVMFIPLGFLAGKEWCWKAIPLSTGFSVIIELIQLISKRGYFEFDDIFHNTLGACFGFLLYYGIYRLYISFINQYSK